MTNPIPRRTFLTSSAALATTTALAAGNSPAAAPPRNFFEWRTYRTAGADRQQFVSRHIESALLPGLERLGLQPIGGFLPDDKTDTSVCLLIPHQSLESVGTLGDRLAADEEYQAAASEFRATPPKNPGYTRIESRLMRAFSGMPTIEVPPQTADRSPRIFELRIYESANEHLARLKVEMFNAGEIQVMRDVKLAPVFYGETLVSNDLPNLTYMLSGENREAHKQHFADFLKHPEWDRLKRIEKYKGTVSKITSVFYKPTSWSQL